MKFVLSVDHAQVRKVNDILVGALVVRLSRRQPPTSELKGSNPVVNK